MDTHGCIQYGMCCQRLQPWSGDCNKKPNDGNNWNDASGLPYFPKDDKTVPIHNIAKILAANEVMDGWMFLPALCVFVCCRCLVICLSL